MSDEGRIIKQSELDDSDTRVRGLGPAEKAPAETRSEESVTVEAARPARSDEEQRVRRLVQAMLSGFAQQRRELLADLQPYVVRIAVEVAQRIVRRELRTDPGLIVRTAETALEQLSSASLVRVRAHPLDAQLLESRMNEIVSARDEAATVEIVPDGSIERGGCVVESDRGIVDARLHTQFEEIQARLFDALDTTGEERESGR